MVIGSNRKFRVPDGDPRRAKTVVEGDDRANHGSRFYRPELDVLRFIAFLLVFLSHSSPNMPIQWAGLTAPWPVSIGSLFNATGGYGVDLFFALSSYLITTLLLIEYERYGRIDAAKFYARRALRIWPLYFLFLFFLGLASLTAHRVIGDQLPRKYLAAFLLLSGNWACAAWGFPAGIASPLWSVSIEEQFYLAWPWVMKRWLKHLPGIAIGLLVVAWVTRIILVADGVGHTATWCNTFARLDPIAAGALLAYYLNSNIPTLTKLCRVMLGFSGFGLLFVAGMFGDISGARCLWSYPLVAVGTVAIIAAFLGASFSWTPLIYLGKISYGLYVFHVAAIKLMLHFRAPYSRLEALALTVVIAAISYELLEKPFLGLKDRFAIVPSRPT